MRNRWRGRRAVLAIVTAGILATVAAAAAMGGSAPPTLRVTLPDGRVVVQLELPAEGTFALRYRNSLYGTLAEERFAMMPDGRMRLAGLAADQLAVLEEYYAADDPRPVAGAMAWEADPAHRPVERVLRVAATDLGERTVLVAGHAPVELWRYVDDSAPSVLLEIER